MNIFTSIKAVVLTSAGFLSVLSVAHAQVITTDAGNVGVKGEGGSYYATSGANGVFPPNTASVIANGLEFHPSVGISAVADSYDTYQQGSSLQLDLNGLFVPESGISIVGITVTVSGLVQASGSGVVNLFESLSFANLSTTGGSATTSWTNLGDNSQAFSFARTFNLPSPIYGSYGAHAALSIGSNVSSTWRGSFCYDYELGICSPAAGGSALLTVSDVKMQALVAVATPVPEADGVWMGGVGVGLLMGRVVAGRRRRLPASCELS